MRSRWVAVAAGLLVCGLAREAKAQKSGGLAIVLFGGYGLPGSNLVEDAGNDIQFKAKGALLLGGQLEIGLSKSMGIDVGVNRTLSQTLDLVQGGTTGETDDMSMTQFTGSLVIRPAGRRPNGAVTPLFVELGGGITMYKFGSAANPASDFKSNRPMGFVGAGYNVAIGPRATLQIFGRAQGITAYTSSGLDTYNAAPPVTNVKGKLMLNFQFGAAIRIGR